MYRNLNYTRMVRTYLLSGLFECFMNLAPWWFLTSLLLFSLPFGKCLFLDKCCKFKFTSLEFSSLLEEDEELLELFLPIIVDHKGGFIIGTYPTDQSYLSMYKEAPKWFPWFSFYLCCEKAEQLEIVEIHNQNRRKY